MGSVFLLVLLPPPPPPPALLGDSGGACIVTASSVELRLLNESLIDMFMMYVPVLNVEMLRNVPESLMANREV